MLGHSYGKALFLFSVSYFLCSFLLRLCCIFQPVFGCYALQTLVKKVIFTGFCAKNLKKQEICSKFLQTTRFFKFAPKPWSTVLFPKNLVILSINLLSKKFSYNLNILHGRGRQHFSWSKRGPVKTAFF